MKQKLMRILDVFMFGLLLLLMAFHLTGQQLHEIFGTITLVCFIVHHVLNWKWHQNILNGRYNTTRKIVTILNIVLLIDILCLGVSGMLMSDFVFSFIPSFGLISLARKTHMIASYLGFVLMSVHLGFHWNMIFIQLKKKMKIKSKYIELLIYNIFPCFICITGLFFFMKNDLLSYMFYIESFVFFDYEITILQFIGQYLTISCFFIGISYIFLKKIRKKRRVEK